MTLKLTIRVALILYILGLIAFYFAEPEQMTWFALGGGLAVFNILFAAWVVRIGFASLKGNSMVLGFFMFKNFTFLVLIAFILLFLKPMLLPFTLGLGLVIVGSVVAALWESRHLLKKET